MQTKRLHRRVFLFLAAGVFCVMLLFNCLTPYIADDYPFAYAFDTGERLHSLPQLLQSLAFHYQTWSGRVVVKFFAQGFTMFPKLLFNLCNTAAYLLLSIVIYRLAVGRRSGRYDYVLFGLIQVSLWEISPAFGQTNLWMCGACNYLWATLGCLSFLLPWRYYLQKSFSSRRWMPVLMAVGGLLAGWLSENTSAGLLVCLVLCLATELIQKRRPPLWMWTGLLGSIAGFLILVTAPGNFARSDGAPDPRPILTRIAIRLLTCMNMLKAYALPLLFLFAAFYTLLCLQNKKIELWPLILLVSGLGANFAMLLSPVYYERSTHGVFAFLTAACAACLAGLNGTTLRKTVAAGAACAGILCCFHLVEAGYDIASFWLMDRTRTQLLQSEIARLEHPEQTTLTTYAIEPYTRWCAAYGLPDIRMDDGDAIAIGRSKWFGVHSLVADTSYTYPFPGHTNAAYEAGEAAAKEQNEIG